MRTSNIASFQLDK